MSLEKFYELVRETYGPFFPTPKKKKEEFLEKVREKVDYYYKQKIEERCGLNLGQIKVKDNKEWLEDTSLDQARNDAIKDAWKQGRIPNEADFTFSFSAAFVANAIIAIPLWVYNTMHGAEMRCNNNTIYVPFYYMNRFMDLDFKKREKTLDYCVVHEISHILWDRKQGSVFNNPQKLGPNRQWFEGFATYCADNFFADFYPDNAEKVEVGRVYSKGKEKIEKLIEKKGTEILLEIPERWHEFENLLGEEE